MPTVPGVSGYRFFSVLHGLSGSDPADNERGEPPHIHVEQAERYAKFWLSEATLAVGHGFRTAQLAELRLLVRQHRDLFQERWNEHFSR